MLLFLTLHYNLLTASENNFLLPASDFKLREKSFAFKQKKNIQYF